MGVRLKSGTRIESYRICRHMATGGEGDIYEALAPKGRTVVLKQHRESVSSPNGAVDAERTMRLRSLQGEKHPNVCEILDVFEHRDLLYVAMEYVDGESLEQIITEHGRLSIAQFRPVLRDILSGLDWLHGQGWVHRDIKPANIIGREEAGGEYCATIVDLCIALQMHLARVTHKSVMMGTFEYAPVEVILGGDREVNARADLYSVGTTMFHAVTGRLPFPEPAGDALLKQIACPERPSMREVVAEIPAPVDRYVQRMMALHPEDRPGSTQEAWRMFEHAVSGSPEYGAPVFPALKPPAARRWPSTPHLLIGSGGFEGKTIPVPREGVTLGRAQLNPGDHAISRFHVRAAAKRTGIILRDLGSRNGLVTEGRRVRRALLHPGSQVLVGATVLKTG